VSYAALAVAVVAVLIASGSLGYARRADRRADRAERKADAAGRAGVLERVGSIMREADLTVAATLNDPMATQRVQAVRARLNVALDNAGVDLPACREYARNVDAKLLPAAEQELERANAAARV
jgi:hypothetical protein